jgi:hypothetical protein
MKIDGIEVESSAPHADPLRGMVGVFTGLTKNVTKTRPFMGQSPGFEFRKTAEIIVGGFDELAKIIARFDNLVSDIETERLSAHS